MARSRGTGLKWEGPLGTAPWKAWPLLFSATSHPLRVHSEHDESGHGAQMSAQGDIGRLPNECGDGLLVTGMEALLFSGGP
jgi:hypothetical protein